MELSYCIDNRSVNVTGYVLVFFILASLMNIYFKCVCTFVFLQLAGVLFANGFNNGNILFHYNCDT